MCVEAAWSPLSRVAGALREIAALFLLCWGAVPYSTVYAMGRRESDVGVTVETRVTCDRCSGAAQPGKCSGEASAYHAVVVWERGVIQRRIDLCERCWGEFVEFLNVETP